MARSLAQRIASPLPTPPRSIAAGGTRTGQPASDDALPMSAPAGSSDGVRDAPRSPIRSSTSTIPASNRPPVTAPARWQVASAIRSRRDTYAVPPAAIDLGGVGKGLAIRWASERAILRLPQDAGLLLDAGGDVVAAGQPPPGGWSVGIEDPAAADPAVAEPLAVLALDGGAIATSSVRVRHWVGSDGRAVHHLLDPRTREPARTGLIAVTVVAPDPAWAEVWTKALFLAGREEIGAEARARGLAAWWVDAGGHLGMTPEARLRTAWAAEARIG